MWRGVRWSSGIVGSGIGSGVHLVANVILYPTPMYALAWMVACFFAIRSHETTAALFMAAAGFVLQAVLYGSGSSITSIIAYANNGVYINFAVRLSIVVCVSLIRKYNIFTDVHIYDLMAGTITALCAWYLPAPMNSVVEEKWNQQSKATRKAIAFVVSCGVIYRCGVFSPYIFLLYI